MKAQSTKIKSIITLSAIASTTFFVSWAGTIQITANPNLQIGQTATAKPRNNPTTQEIVQFLLANHQHIITIGQWVYTQTYDRREAPTIPNDSRFRWVYCRDKAGNTIYLWNRRNGWAQIVGNRIYSSQAPTNTVFATSYIYVQNGQVIAVNPPGAYSYIPGRGWAKLRN